VALLAELDVLEVAVLIIPEPVSRSASRRMRACEMGQRGSLTLWTMPSGAARFPTYVTGERSR
jgi:hypothetical protein